MLFIFFIMQDSVVKFARLSANLDGPEGGLEALLQVAACTKVSK